MHVGHRVPLTRILLDGRKYREEKGRENADDRDHDKKLYEREAAPAPDVEGSADRGNFETEIFAVLHMIIHVVVYFCRAQQMC